MIIGIISFLCSVVFLLFTIKKYKHTKLISPIIIFFALWTLIIGLSLLGLYNITRPSDTAYALIFTMITSFFVGSVVGDKIKLRTTSQPTKKAIVDKNDKLFILYMVCAITILFNLIDVILVLINLSKGTPMWQIRNWTLEPYGSSNPILSRRTFLEELIRATLCAPMMIILPAIASYYLFNSKNKTQKRILMILTIIVLCLNAISGGGSRLSFLYLILCLGCSYFIARKTQSIKKLTRKTKRIIFILVCGSLAIMAFATIARTGIGNLFKQFYTYFALPPTLLSLWLPTLQNTPHTFGLLTTFGIHSYLFRMLGTLGLNALVPPIFNTAFSAMLNAETFLPVGYGIANAFVTPVYYFYIDGGVIFTILASFIFGLIVTITTRKINHNINARNFLVYMLIMYGVFVSFMRIQTVIPNYIISFLLVFWIFGKQGPAHDYKDILAFTTQAKLSIILPVYNGESYIEECVKQLEKIKNINYEIIIIDDGSSDNTLKKAQALQKQFSNITLVINKENLGASHARNLGLNKATGDYVICVDVDDKISPKMYELLLKNATLNDADISMCDYYEDYNGVKLNSKYHYTASVITHPAIIKSYLTDKISNNVWDKMFSKKIIAKTKFDERLHIGEDILFCLDIFSKATTVCRLPDQLLGYVQVPNSAMHTVNSRLTEYKTVLEYIPTRLKHDLSKKCPNQYQYFQSEMIVRGIHALSLATNRANQAETIKLLSNYYTNADLTKIIKNKEFSKFTRIEMKVLQTFGPKVHLALMPAYKLIRKATR